MVIQQLLYENILHDGMGIIIIIQKSRYYPFPIRHRWVCSSPTAHYEAALVSRDIWRAQRVPPAPRKISFRVSNHETTV